MADNLSAIASTERTLRAAVDAFLAKPCSQRTHRTYARTLNHLIQAVGPERPLAGLSSDELAEAVTALWGSLAPRTWNRQVATVRSLLSWCRRHRWPIGGLELQVDRRQVGEHETKVISLHELERLWSSPGIPIRERALWRLLYDSAGRAEDALRLNVPGLDLVNRRAQARTSSGHWRPLHFQTGAARLLAELIAGRSEGPVFIAYRRPNSPRVRDGRDFDPVSGRARLSYARAELLFNQYSGGKTLHQLRHSRLTHLGEQDISAPLLMAISGHKRLESLQRYIKPSQEAVAALLAATDPDQRR
jgi:integrase